MKNKGITLIALVITIIILLILAGITISQLTGSGLFENSKLAKEKWDNAQEIEDDILKQYENTISSGRDTVTLTSEQYQNILNRLAALENRNAYSTNENGIRIGTWINGKPLYMQTITTTSPNSETGTTKPVPANIETLVNFEGSMLNSNNDWNVFSSTYGPINCFYHKDSDELSWEGIPNWGRNRSVNITFYYTKTTDPLPSTN